MKKTFFIVLLMSLTFFLNAQSISEFQIGLSSPNGKFADDDEDDFLFDGSGAASKGVYLGYKYLSPLNTDGLFWTLGAGVMYNDIQSFLKDDLIDYLEDFDDYSLPKYINVPILAGLQYEKSISGTLKIYGEGGIGVNALKITNLYYDNDGYEYTEIFKPSFSLGYKIGAGVVLQDKYTIGLTYMGLGSHKVEIEGVAEYDGEREKDKDRFNKALPVSSINITVGIRL